MTEADSMNQTVMQHLEDAMDSGKDITDSKVRKEIITDIEEKYPKWDSKSITSSISKMKNKIAKKRGLQPSDLGVGKKKKLFDDALDMEVDKTGAVEDKGLSAKNPKFAKDKDGKPIIKKERESKLSESVYGSVGNLAYDMFALTDSDMEELTDAEKKDMGNVLKALGDQYVGEKGELVLGFGALLGLFLNKKRKAIRVRKTRELKEGKPKKDLKKLPEPKKDDVDESTTIHTEGGKQS